jgi:NAD(P)-dependent dehydrogenase (short-subunit alcohol dehydrogenase family)
MDLGLKGRIAMVTGGGSGIGKGVAFEFAREGVVTYISGRHEARLAETVSEARSQCLELIPYVLDVRDFSAVEKCVQTISADKGHLDIWINNAGYGHAKPIDEVTEEDWDTTIDTNLKALFFCIKAVSAQMKKQKQGVIVNASSLAVRMPLNSNAPYAASKSGVTSLTRSLAAELAPYNIRVVGYIPGMIATEMSKRHIARARDELLSTIALKRFGYPEDLAKPIVFLCSDACGYITGVELEISGGRHSAQRTGDSWERAGSEAVWPKE